MVERHRGAPPGDVSRCCGYTPRCSESTGRAPRRQDDTIALYRLSRPGGVRGSDRSSVGCSHREGCPLFPLLNKSLRGWRDFYCDHGDRWHDCARYKVSRTGRPMPITLLPNGHDAQYLIDRAGAAESRHASTQEPPSRPPSGPPEPTGHTDLFQPVRKPAPDRPLEPSPPAQVPQSAGRSPTVAQRPGSTPTRVTRPARRAHGSIRRWWTRLTDWMTGPA